MSSRIYYIAETGSSVTADEQVESGYVTGDTIVYSGRSGFPDILKRLSRHGQTLKAGDTLKIYDLSCFPDNTMTLIRAFRKILSEGVSIEIHKPGLILSGDPVKNELGTFVAMLDHHWSHIHGIKSHPPDSRPGRKVRITIEQLPDIRKRLSAKGATVSSVARDIGVGRSTLFDFLRRHS